MTDYTFQDPRLPARFWSKARDTGSCWLWEAGKFPDGYGAFYITGDRRPYGAHRVAYEALAGRIPDGLVLDHLCRVRNCVNPAHLEPKTNRENLIAPGSESVAARIHWTHCPRGHEFAPGNLVRAYVRKGLRKCRACQSANSRRTYLRKLGLVMSDTDFQAWADGKAAEYVLQ
jgi:hypothetical protein